MIGQGPPTACGDYPHDPEPTPRCATCKSDNVRCEGGKEGWCFECEDNREMEDDTE